MWPKPQEPTWAAPAPTHSTVNETWRQQFPLAAYSTSLPWNPNKHPIFRFASSPSPASSLLFCVWIPNKPDCSCGNETDGGVGSLNPVFRLFAVVFRRARRRLPRLPADLCRARLRHRPIRQDIHYMVGLIYPEPWAWPWVKTSIPVELFGTCSCF